MSLAPLLLAAVVTVAATLAPVVTLHTMNNVSCETIFYLGDPQIGFSGNLTLDAHRFNLAAEAAAGNSAAWAVVAGDLVNIWNNITQIELYKSVWPGSFAATPVHQVPGNHDIDSESSTVDEALARLEHYRSTFSTDDYSSFQTNFGQFTLVNSEMLIMPYLGLNGTTDRTILDPVDAQWAWLEQQLAAAKASKPHSIIVTHHPPFRTLRMNRINTSTCRLSHGNGSWI
jgi:3',5'-cyclic AMP phosphodiesterase CpdA